jgi:nitrite reductase/ring-hydroxylating ferredoxin subunit
MAWKAACKEGAIGQNDMKEFDVDGITVLLTRVKHIWQWDLRTGACAGTESRIPLKMYQVRKTAGQVEVFLEQPLVYEYDA